MSDEVLAVTEWRTNAHMIADIARLGYLQKDLLTLDPTWGLGKWWTIWRPTYLVGTDLDPEKSSTGTSVDFTATGYRDGEFPQIAFDPPYKLNGTPSADVDARYGVHVVRSREERHALMLDGMTELTRVLAPGGVLLVKCQNQVNGGHVRWQTDLMTAQAASLGLDKVDELHMIAYRPQPDGTVQEHARRNHSTAQVYRKPGKLDAAPTLL